MINTMRLCVLWWLSGLRRRSFDSEVRATQIRSPNQAFFNLIKLIYSAGWIAYITCRSAAGWIGFPLVLSGQEGSMTPSLDSPPSSRLSVPTRQPTDQLTRLSADQSIQQPTRSPADQCAWVYRLISSPDSSTRSHWWSVHLLYLAIMLLWMYRVSSTM